jgi:phosphate starvation-inducible PhoH-like protein
MVFDDNRLLPALFGGQNSHLTMLEETLGIQIQSRGNELTLVGAKADTLRAREILTILWDKLRQGHDVDNQIVDAALRFSIADKEVKAQQQRSGQSMTSNPTQNPTHLKDFAETKGQIIVRKKTIAARSPMQSNYIEAMQKREAVFGIGPAGTGKTYLAVAQAVALFEQERIERIILSRPAVEAGENLGFLPGDLKEKIDPYLRPLYDALYDTMGAEKAEKRILAKDIEIAPLAFMRGRTLTNAFVILDEAQNTTSMQMKMFLTRLGEGSRMVITGDPTQVDLPKGETSGLLDAVDILRDVPEVGVIRFGTKDVVRSALVAKIVGAYDRSDAEKKS